MELKLADYKTDVHNDWCPGCGDFGILSSIQMTLAEMQIETHNVAVFSGIGCSGKAIHYINTYGIHTLHGRVLPYALGAKMANPNLEVIVVGGDGDGLGIGVGHFVNAARRNVNITYILFNNGVYGLTKGQASPTLDRNMKPKSISKPNINDSINPIILALAAGYTFIARGYSFEVVHLKEIIKKGIEHKGTSLIDVLQPCPTYNDINTKEWYGGEDRKDPHTKKPLPRFYKLTEEEENNSTVLDGDRNISSVSNNIFQKAMNSEDGIPIGVFYQNKAIPSYEERVVNNIPDYVDNYPSKQCIRNSDGKSTTDLRKQFEELRVK